MTEKAPVSNSKCDFKCLFLITRQQTGCSGIPRSYSHIANPLWSFLASKYNYHCLGDFCWVSRVFTGLKQFEYFVYFIFFDKNKMSRSKVSVIMGRELGEWATDLSLWKSVQSFIYVSWSWWRRGCMGYSWGKQQNAWPYNCASTCLWTSQNTVRVLTREGNTIEETLTLDVITRALGRVSCISSTSSTDINHSFLETM